MCPFNTKVRDFPSQAFLSSVYAAVLVATLYSVLDCLCLLTTLLSGVYSRAEIIYAFNIIQTLNNRVFRCTWAWTCPSVRSSTKWSKRVKVYDNTSAMRASRSRNIERFSLGEPRSRSASFDQHESHRSHNHRERSGFAAAARGRNEGGHLERTGEPQPTVSADGSTIFALSECA